MVKIERKNLTTLFNEINKNYPLYLPIKKAGEVNFAEYFEGAEVNLEKLKTVKSPKEFFFPQSEDMMKFKTENGNLKIIDEREAKKPFVIFGVKACDYKAFSVLDNVFLSDPVDTFYKARREAGVIVTLACGKPEISCFCKVFGIDASAPEGDVTSYMDDNYLYLKANTEKGENLLQSIKDLTVSADESETDKLKEEIKNRIEKLPYSNLDLSVFTPENINHLFEREEEWKELSTACIGCGTCTFVCPTCQCFDIRDFKTNSGVIRFRCWDSCMYSDFTQMAAENSRTTQMQRFRQRFMHKLCYYPSQYGGVKSCVGCGRCVNACPQNLNIIKVIKKMGEKKNG